MATADVHAEVTVPHFTRAMMDGYAVVAESTFGATSYQPATLTVIGAVRTGQPPSVRLSSDQLSSQA